LAIFDTGSRPEVVSEGWPHTNRLNITHPLHPATTWIRFSKDNLSMLGTLGLILCLANSLGHAHTLPLPAVLVVAIDAIPLLVCPQTCAAYGIIMDSAADTVCVRRTDFSFHCAVSNGPLCLPRQANPHSTYRTAAELPKIRRQFDNTGADKEVVAFYRGRFPPGNWHVSPASCSTATRAKRTPTWHDSPSMACPPGLRT